MYKIKYYRYKNPERWLNVDKSNWSKNISVNSAVNQSYIHSLGFTQAVSLVSVLELRLSFWMLQNAGEGLKVQAMQWVHTGALVRVHVVKAL